MTTLSVSGNTRLSYSLSDAPVIGSASESAELRTSQSVSNGTGPGQANVAWRDRVTVTGGAAYSFDLLTLGATVFGFDGVVAINTLKDVLIINNTTATGAQLLVGVIGPSDTTGYAAKINRGGSYRVTDYSDGWPVTTGVNNTFYVANPTTGPVEFDVLLIGVGSTSND